MTQNTDNDTDYIDLIQRILNNYRVTYFEQTLRSDATMTLVIQLESKSGEAPSANIKTSISDAP